jgi:hypothetical protein
MINTPERLADVIGNAVRLAQIAPARPKKW